VSELTETPKMLWCRSKGLAGMVSAQFKATGPTENKPSGLLHLQSQNLPCNSGTKALTPEWRRECFHLYSNWKGWNLTFDFDFYYSAYTSS